ncbi:helix-turn-helix domain-containing protein [Bifidobacterium asteroides]|uniref:helix-turn-helix domain-containing protein n=2 Tax=Bifidobacterium TaxID=1678 RepID=UPI0037C0C9B9
MTTKTRERKAATSSLESVISMNMKVALAIRNKSQSDLARSMGVSSGVISQKMHGTTAWTISDMEKAGEFLGIQPAKFLEPNGLLVAGSGFEPETSGL